MCTTTTAFLPIVKSCKNYGVVVHCFPRPQTIQLQYLLLLTENVAVVYQDLFSPPWLFNRNGEAALKKIAIFVLTQGSEIVPVHYQKCVSHKCDRFLVCGCATMRKGQA